MLDLFCKFFGKRLCLGEEEINEFDTELPYKQEHDGLTNDDPRHTKNGSPNSTEGVSRGYLKGLTGDQCHEHLKHRHKEEYGVSPQAVRCDPFFKLPRLVEHCDKGLANVNENEGTQQNICDGDTDGNGAPLDLCHFLQRLRGTHSFRLFEIIFRGICL